MTGFFQDIAEKSRQSGSFAVFVGILLFLFFLAVVSQVTIASVAKLAGIPIQSLTAFIQGDLDIHRNGANIFRLVQLVNQFLIYGVVAWLMAGLLGKQTEVLGLSRKASSQHIILATIILLLSIPLVQALMIDANALELPAFLAGWEAWIKAGEAQRQDVLMRLFSDSDPGNLLFNLGVFALTPAIFEEIFFRGFVQKQLSRFTTPHTAIWISAFFFSFIHFQFLGFFSRLFLGALLGYFFWRSGSLWPCMIAHFFFNAISVLTVYLVTSQGVLDPALAEDTYQFPWIWVFLSTISVGLLLFVYFRRNLTDDTPAPHE